MKRLAPAIALLLCLIVAVSQAAPARAAKDSWTSVRSKNFLLIGNASEKEIREVATKLEQFRDVFSRLLSKANFNSPVPTTVFVFKSGSSYKPYKPLYQGKPANVSGYFQPGQDVNYITLSVESADDNPYDIIFHEFVHLLVANNMASTPVWFNEGLAEYYSTFDVTDGDKKAWLGKPKTDYVLLLREQKLLPLKTLFSVDHNSPLYNERNKQTIFYAESWALVHYLLQGNNGQRKQQLDRFVELVGGGANIDDAFKQAFQTDFATMEKELKQYVQRDTYLATIATFRKKLEFDAEMQSAPLTEAEAQAALGDLLLHINRPEDAESRLTQALELDPKLASALASLGMVRLRQHRYREAREALQRAVAANSQNYLAHYYYAYVISRLEESEGQGISRYAPEDLREMRSALKKAIELKPDFPDSYHILAFVNLVAGEQLDESISMLKRALTLSPGNQGYVFVMAQLYMQKQDFETARRLLTPISRDASDPGLRSGADSLLQSIADIQERQARYNAARSAAEANQSSVRSSRSENREARDNTEQNSINSYDPSSALEEALRPVRPGEKRAQGVLVRVDCDAGGIVFTLRVEDRLVKLHAASFDGMDITTYTTDVGGEISCGPRKPENKVVITYRPSAANRKGFEGEAVSLEFVPKDFALKKQ